VTLGWSGTAANYFGFCLYVAIDFPLKNHCKVTSNKIPHPLTLGDLQSFKQKLTLLFQVQWSQQVQLHAFCPDVESLPMGAQAHTMAFLAF
jgi:hypothetical protein